MVNEGRIIASPLAKKTAEKEGVDLRYVVGTGPNGSIIEKDVLSAKASSKLPVTSARTSSTSVAIAPAGGTSGRVVATPDAKKVAKQEKVDLATSCQSN